MKKALFVAAGALAIAGAPAAAQAQDMLGKLFKTLVRPAGTAAPLRQIAPPAMATPNSAQEAQVRNALAQVSVPAPVRADLTDAAPLLEKTIITMGCATEARAFHALNSQRVKPRNHGTPDDTLYFTAMGGMKYHDRNTCVALNRIAKIEKPALNAMVVTLNFVSDSSGEAAVKTVSLRKLDGRWLLDTLGAWEV